MAWCRQGCSVGIITERGVYSKRAHPAFVLGDLIYEREGLAGIGLGLCVFDGCLT